MNGADQRNNTSPLSQIRERGYTEKYRSDPRQLYEIGIVFDPESRNIEQWDVG